jgi:hypothetical protein
VNETLQFNMVEANRARRFRTVHKLKGLCVNCIEQSIPGKCHCEYHVQMFRRSGKRRYERCKRLGLCVKGCGRRARPGRVHCIVCRSA